MVIVQKSRIGKKITGGMYKQHRKKRKFEIGRRPVLTSIGNKKINVIKTKGGGTKAKIMLTDIVNLFDPKTKKFSQTKVKIVTENPANRHYIRMNALTKGAIVDTDKGKVRITSRPSQDGCVNGVLVL